MARHVRQFRILIKMKKISRLAAVLILATSFGVPLLVVAGTQTVGQSCYENGDCVSGLVCTSNSTCQSSVGGTQTTSGTPGSVDQKYLIYYKDTIVWVVNTILVPVLIAIAFAVFLWGIFKYFVWGAENESEKADGRKFAMWGITGLVIIFSTWALVNIVRYTLFPSTISNIAPTPPKL